MKELTCGNFGGLIWYRYCFAISIDSKQVIIKIPFRRYVIPLTAVDRLCSEGTSQKLAYGNARLQIVHHSEQAPKDVYFISTDWDAWFTAFESNGIKSEDNWNIRNTNTATLAWARRINLFAGALAASIAVIGVVAVLGASIIISLRK